MCPRTLSIRAFVEPLIAVSFTLATATLVGAGELTRPEKLALREALRQLDSASTHRSKVYVVDGAPRPTTTVSVTPVAETARLRSRVAQDSGPARSVTTVIGESGMLSPYGGDDVLIGSNPSYVGPAHLAITNDGTFFVAQSTGIQVEVHRSTDGGENWSLWSTVSDPTSSISRLADMELAEGADDRLFLAWSASDGGDLTVRVAYADPAASVPTWTVVNALDDTGIHHGVGQRVDIDTDAAAFPTYFVYVIASSDDGDGRDIGFSRSTNLGDSYAPGYRLASTATSIYQEFDEPKIGFGHDDWVHAAYKADTNTSSFGWQMVYHRAPMWADGGAGSWEGRQTIVGDLGGNSNTLLALGASPSESVVILSSLAGPGGAAIHYSTDSGATWPPSNTTTTTIPPASTEPLFLPGGEVVMGTIEVTEFNPLYQIEIARASTADLSTWSTPEAYTRGEWTVLELPPFVGLAADPTRDHRTALAWKVGFDGQDQIRFDAGWRRDPGYGNTEVGFPIPVTGGGQTPPAIAEVDGDTESEIVFGTLAGDIHVLNHDGTPVPGWPVNIGSMPFDAPVAVGDLGGGGYHQVVAGTSGGEVWAFNADGTLMPGWPVSMGFQEPVYVSIGELGAPHVRYVVATGGNEVRAFAGDGSRADVPNWDPLPASAGWPASIGDIDKDGVTEVVTVAGSFLDVHVLGIPAPKVSRIFAGEDLADAATLGDVDNDSDLEIAVPTSTGSMYLLNDDLSDYSASWPITVPSNQALTAACMADVLSGDELELMFAERQGSGLVHLFFINGTEGVGYPASLDTHPLYMPPIVDEGSLAPGNVIMATPPGFGYNFDNFADPAPGWPRNLPGIVEETPAAGDIDNDGRNEIVFLGVDFLTVLDVGETDASFPHNRWPMYQFDAKRTGCFECDTFGPVAVDDVPVAIRTALHVHPNPFNPTTTLTYEIAEAGTVTMALYDAHGRVVDMLMTARHHEPSRYAISYEPRVGSGLYFLRLEVAGSAVVHKLSVLK